MGQLVFQAALGGQVNLVGPNTASTLNINVPAFAGTMASLASVNNNGVTYVNSSGQPTTLSTFVFDGANMGIGTASPSYPLDVASNSIGSGVRIRGNVSANTGILEFTNNGVTAETASIKVDGSNNIIFSNTGTIVERMRIDSSGNVGIGTSSPVTKLDVAGTIRSTSGNIVAVDGGAFGWGTTTAYVGGTSASNLITFTTASTERMRIDASGNVLVTSAAGLGYGTGAGGTVTQATSKSTGVTLNKPTGQITMNNAALAANTNVNFTLTNSLITSSADVIVVNDVAGMAAYGTYSFFARAQGAGSAVISVRNVTAGSLSEAIVLSFVIIKGSTS